MRLHNQVFDHPARFEITLSLKLAVVKYLRSHIVNQVNLEYRKKLEKLNLLVSKNRPKNESTNDNHEALKVIESTEHGLLTFYISEHGLSLRLKYKDFLHPSSISEELGLKYIESEKSFSELCLLLKPSHIDIKQGQETCKGGYKKCGWCLVSTDEQTLFKYRVGGIVK